MADAYVTSLEKAVENRLKYLDLLVKVKELKVGTDDHTIHLMDATNDIRKQYQIAKKITQAEGLRLQSLVDTSALDDDMKNILGTVMAEKIAGGKAGAESYKQRIMHFDMYQTKDLQQLYASTAYPQAKLLGGAKHMVSLKLVRLTEPSWAHCLAIILQTELAHIDGDQRKDHLEHLKELVRVSSVGVSIGTEEYPEDIEYFFSQHPELARSVFGDGKPAPSVLDRVDRTFLNRNAPCRSSNKQCTKQGTSKISPPCRGRSQHRLARSLEDILPDASQERAPRFNRQNSNDDLLSNVRFFPPRDRSEDVRSPEQQLLALGWTPPPVEITERPKTHQDLPAIADAPANSPAGEVVAPGSDIDRIDDITAKMRARLSKGKEETKNEDSESEDESEEPPAKPAKKRPAKDISKDKEKSKEKTKKKKKSVVDSKKVDACLKEVQKHLPFVGTKAKHYPMYYKTVTIYLKKGGAWRCKPGAARRDEKIVSFASNDVRSAWRDLQLRAAEYLATA